ncbi:DUF1266 domain-containing protein [Salmonella enterica subsp. enterica serovar Fluntern]|nr:DUF1266 domain-containing protein [Salmonella enterica subsp. enterica serovar Fluntern]EAB1663170.1 DUF1266 domain-containing protein [Salmonella enterica]ECI0550610.1 DUF1266 domain-containing protein [Salmonella enterica subsp. enterica]EAA3234946.1 DUF1266 domain-containing protein [Salmonella enterica subsp. enterica serovar Fluntern]EAP9554251.1 DUF1266 domain-containing protein [Salmonella enterica]
MDKDEQYLLFALSTPMEVLYIGNEPSHTSPAMYTGIPAVDLSDSWGIDNREDLIQTIYRMTDDGHAADLAPFYTRWFTLSPRQWREFTVQLSEQGQIYARFVAETALCCGRGGIKAWDYVRMGVLNQWLTEEESLWLQSRIYARAYYFYDGWIQYFAAYSLGRLYWQTEGGDIQEHFTLLQYDHSGKRMFNELASSTESYYAQLPWRPLNEQPICPETLKGVSDL